MPIISKILSRYCAYFILSKLATHFTQWNEYHDGWIDADGLITKKGSRQLDPLSNLIRKIKRVIEKYSGISSKIAALLVGAAMLREEIMKTQEYGTLSEEGDDNFLLQEELVAEMAKVFGLDISEIGPSALTPNTYIVESAITGKTHVIDVTEQLVSDEFGVFCYSDVLGKTIYFSKDNAMLTGGAGD